MSLIKSLTLLIALHSRESWRFLPFILLCLFLSACSPIKKTQFDKSEKKLSQVDIIPFEGRNGQILALALENRLSARSKNIKKIYQLKITDLQTSAPQTLNNQAVSIRIVANVELSDEHNVIFTAKIRGIESYSFNENLFVQENAKKEAIKNVSKQMADIIFLRIKTYFLSSLNSENQ